jgi:hypothetical protein
MKHVNFKALLLLMITVQSITVKAQEVINSSGGNASSIAGSVSYSIGQVIYTTNIETNGSVAQGIQQPYEVYVITGVSEAKEINLSCIAFPNPTTDILKLKVNSDNLKELSFQLFDTNGKLLESRQINETETILQMNALPSGSYILNINSFNRNIKTFKIIKN